MMMMISAPGYRALLLLFWMILIFCTYHKLKMCTFQNCEAPLVKHPNVYLHNSIKGKYRGHSSIVDQNINLSTKEGLCPTEKSSHRKDILSKLSLAFRFWSFWPSSSSSLSLYIHHHDHHQPAPKFPPVSLA